MNQTYLLLGILALLWLMNRKQAAGTPAAAPTAAPAQGTEPQTVDNVISRITGAIQTTLGQVQDVINYGTSQGLDEATFQTPEDLSNSPGQNPDEAKKVALTNARRIKAGPAKVVSGPRIAANPRFVPVRPQAKGAVPYSPYARSQAVDRIKALLK